MSHATGTPRGARPIGRLPALALSLAVATALAVSLWIALAAGLGETYDRRVGDLLWPRGSVDERILVVAIDSASIEEVGPWPWPRTVQADLVDALDDLGADVIVSSVVLAPPSQDDAAFAQAAEQVGGVVLATVPVEVADPDALDTLRVLDQVEPSAALQQAAVDLGHALVLPDPDGVVRTLPLALESADGALQPALSLAGATARLDSPGTPSPLLLRDGIVEYGAVVAPVESEQRLRVSWPAVPQETVLSATDVLRGRLDRDLSGTLVLVGVTDAAVAGALPTPGGSGQETPGVLIHAAAAHTLLTSTWAALVPTPLTLGLAWLLGGLVTFVVLRVNLLAAGLTSGLVLVVSVLVPIALFEVFGWVPDLVRLVLTVAACVLVGLGARSLVEGRQRRLAVSLFSRYVPERVALDLVDRGRLESVLEGERVDVAVLFCDLRGFTPLAESLPPEDVRRVLNAYYDYTCARILDAQGTVMQFVGDEVFAVFGAPLAISDAAGAAVATARRLQDERSSLHELLDLHGLPRVEFGVSVHAGTVVAAHVGTDFRRQYAVIGDTVNLGSRLCGQARAGEVVVSTPTIGRLDLSLDAVAEEVTVKGVASPVSVTRLTSGAG